MSAAAIRPATQRDLAQVVGVELEAGQLFHAVGMSEVAGHEPAEADFRTAIEAERLWVAQLDEEVVGFIMAEVLDGNAHVAQVSVAPRHGRNGIGRSLVVLVEAWGRHAGSPATTLTTFRDVPWNGPYYARLGYREMEPGAIGPELAAAMEHEAAIPGIDATRRCAMVKANTGPRPPRAGGVPAHG